MTGVSPLDAGGLLAALSEAKVNFVVIGGFAVSAHGYPRATKDLDIVPAPDAENLERLAAVLQETEQQRRWSRPTSSSTNSALLASRTKCSATRCVSAAMSIWSP